MYRRCTGSDTGSLWNESRGKSEILQFEFGPVVLQAPNTPTLLLTIRHKAGVRVEKIGDSTGPIEA